MCAALQKTKDLYFVSSDGIFPFQTGKCFLREAVRPDEPGFGCEFISSCSSMAAARTTMPIGVKKKKIKKFANTSFQKFLLGMWAEQS